MSNDNTMPDAHAVQVALQEEIRLRRQGNPHHPASMSAIAAMDAWLGELMIQQALLPKS